MKHVLIAVAIIGGLAACSRGGEPEAVIEELARVGETGRCDRLPQLITKASRDMVGSKLETACKTGIEQRKADPAKAERKLKRLNVLSKTENGDKTTVRAEPEYEDGSKETAQDFVMVKEDGEWKIDLLATGMAAGAGGGAPK
jgi:hypothetical protein